jgi:hypothetical protein
LFSVEQAISGIRGGGEGSIHLEMPHRYNLQATGQGSKSSRRNEGRSRKSEEYALIETTTSGRTELGGFDLVTKTLKI